MMKLQLLHGPGIISSRKQLTLLKSQFTQNNIIVFNKSSNIQELFDNVNTLSLIGEPRLFVIENIGEIPNLERLTPEDNSQIVFWYDKQLEEKHKIFQFMKINNGQIKLFSERVETTIFPLLDYLGNRDKRAFIELSKLKKGDFDLQYIITMILYLLRNLAVLPKGPEFVRKKMAKQRQNFTEQEIQLLYKQVLEIDFKYKSGFLEKEQAEFMVINVFLKLT